jgi:transposase-like protein
MSSSKRMLKTLTYEEKAAVIWEVVNGFKTKSLVAKEFGIPPNTLSTYLKNKETILNKLATSSVKGRKRARELENPDVDECIYKWFNQTRDKKYSLVGC